MMCARVASMMCGPWGNSMAESKQLAAAADELWLADVGRGM